MHWFYPLLSFVITAGLFIGAWQVSKSIYYHNVKKEDCNTTKLGLGCADWNNTYKVCMKGKMSDGKCTYYTPLLPILMALFGVISLVLGMVSLYRAFPHKPRMGSQMGFKGIW